MPLTDLPQIAHAQSHQFFLMAGPCAIEGDEMAMRIAEKIKSVTDALSIPFILK
jgi:2-dehydro-3-deoxyphosphooctonate aldolase (KDO 8-P synthase)